MHLAFSGLITVRFAPRKEPEALRFKPSGHEGPQIVSPSLAVAPMDQRRRSSQLRLVSTPRRVKGSTRSKMPASSRWPGEIPRSRTALRVEMFPEIPRHRSPLSRKGTWGRRIKAAWLKTSKIFVFLLLARRNGPSGPSRQGGAWQKPLMAISKSADRSRRGAPEQQNSAIF